MLTIFSTAKPFRGHIAVIQANAMRSWALLRPRPEVILFGDEEGTAEMAGELGFRYVPQMECNEHGTPLMSSLFNAAQEMASNEVVCYVNADILLMGDFMEAVQRVAALERPSLMVGRRWGLDVDELWDFSQPGWEVALRERCLSSGRLVSWDAIDYFVFPRGLFADMPSFALARTAWDNWLIYRARFLRMPVIDSTRVVMAVHQNHDYSHHSGGLEGVWKGPEARRNVELAGGASHRFCIADATHILTDGALSPAVGLTYLWRRLYTVSVFYPVFSPLRWLIDVLLKGSRGLRRRLGWELSRWELYRGTRSQ
jgi:hypothetical protein